MVKLVSKVALSIVLILFLYMLFFVHSYTIADGKVITQLLSLKTLTVDGILGKAGIDLRSEDVVTPGFNKTLYAGKVIIIRAKPVNVVVDGKKSLFYTTKQSVGGLLEEKNISIEDRDYVNPALESKIFANQEIIVKHYRIVVKKVNVPIPFDTVYAKNRLLEKGKTVKLRNGRDGILEKEFHIVYFGGEKVNEELAGESVIKPAVSRVYETGEASFNGNYLRKFTMVATAYSPRVVETDTNPWVTATGMRSGIGVVAVDPQIIPLGSLLYVKGYGYAIAGDTGGAIKGNRIDLFFYSTYDALKWGRRTVTVYLLPGKWKFPSKLNY